MFRGSEPPPSLEGETFHIKIVEKDDSSHNRFCDILTFSKKVLVIQKPNESGTQGDAENGSE
ncbi:MAG TPA: hypothetical protein VJ951_05830 [Bacteroidales bacterium]|nr:hypothetical protein [Bacteroidales bacterium]